MNERAMTADGYIKDQDYTDDIPYGYWPSSFNGCGWIAVFNYMHGMGMPDTPEEVYAEMLRILPYEGRRGTPFPTMAEFFRKRGIPASRHYGQKGLLRKADKVPAGIVRYVECGEPHYVAFVRTGEGRYRFFNSADGMEDIETDMEHFVEEHVTRKDLIRLLLPGKRAPRRAAENTPVPRTPVPGAPHAGG